MQISVSVVVASSYLPHLPPLQSLYFIYHRLFDKPYLFVATNHRVSCFLAANPGNSSENRKVFFRDVYLFAYYIYPCHHVLMPWWFIILFQCLAVFGYCSKILSLITIKALRQRLYIKNGKGKNNFLKLE